MEQVQLKNHDQQEKDGLELGKTGFPGGSVGKNPPANAGDTGLIPGLEKGMATLQYSCLGNPTDKGVWQAAVHGVQNELGTT